MVARRSLIILFFIVLLTSCRTFDSTSPTPDSASELTPLAETPTLEPDYVSQLRNAEYQLGFTDALTVVQLTDGQYETGTAGSADHITVTMTDYIVKDSFNGSGYTQYAVLVAESYGGSGTFVFLAVYEDENGTPKFVTSRFVDDRPQIN